jgi:hypothetical protein
MTGLKTRNEGHSAGLLFSNVCGIDGHKLEWDILFLQDHSDSTGTSGKGDAMKLQDHVDLDYRKECQ